MAEGGNGPDRMTASSDGSKGRDDALRALHDIGLSPEPTKLLAAIADEVSDSMLNEMSAADYGQSPGLHLEGLVGIRDRRLSPDPLGWQPRQVLELIRWSQPEDPAWSPGSTGRQAVWKSLAERFLAKRPVPWTELLLEGIREWPVTPPK